MFTYSQFGTNRPSSANLHVHLKQRNQVFSFVWFCRNYGGMISKNPYYFAYGF